MGQQRCRIVGDGVGHDIDLGAKQRRGKELPYRNIETLGRGLGNNISASQVQIRLLAQLVIEHSGLLDHHPFGGAGRARGEDHIGQIIRRAVDLRLGARAARGLHLIPDQQQGPLFRRQQRKQSLRLFTTGSTGHQRRNPTQLQQIQQTLLRQLRVQRQVSRASLEAGKHHAQQLQAALGQQRNRLVDADTGCDQRLSKTIGPGVQLAIGPALLKTGGDHAVRVRRQLRLKQAYIPLIQRVVAGGLVTGLQQLPTFGGVDHRQVGELAIGMLANRQQQALEIRQQALDRSLIEEAFVVRQVQAQRIAGVHHHRHRVIGVSAGAVGPGADLLRTADHRAFYRGVFVDEQAVENRLAFFQPAACLNLQQRQMLVFAQRQVVLEQVLQPTLHADALPGARQAHT